MTLRFSFGRSGRRTMMLRCIYMGRLRRQGEPGLSLHLMERIGLQMYSRHGATYSSLFGASEYPSFCFRSSGAFIIAVGLLFLVTTNTWPLATSAAIRIRCLRAWLIGMKVTTHAAPRFPLPECCGQGVVPSVHSIAAPARHTAHTS